MVTLNTALAFYVPSAVGEARALARQQVRPHTTIHLSGHYYICVRILLYMCPHDIV